VLFAGVATSIAALPVLAAIAGERSLARTTAGAIATAATGLMDVLARLAPAAPLTGTARHRGADRDARCPATPAGGDLAATRRPSAKGPAAGIPCREACDKTASLGGDRGFSSSAGREGSPMASPSTKREGQVACPQRPARRLPREPEIRRGAAAPGQVLR
jgi:hypothetical protein